MNEIGNFQIDDNSYLALTPAGALYAVSSATSNGSRDFLLRLLQEKQNPSLTKQNLNRLTGLENQIAISFLYQIQSAYFIQSLPSAKEPLSLSEGYQILLPLLIKLSDEEKVLLLDQHSRILISHKYSRSSSEMLASYVKQQLTLIEQLKQLQSQFVELDSCGFSLLNWRGFSQISIWPLYWHQHLYTLVISGMPRLNHPVLVDLIWSLSPQK